MFYRYFRITQFGALKFTARETSIGVVLYFHLGFGERGVAVEQKR